MLLSFCYGFFKKPSNYYAMFYYVETIPKLQFGECVVRILVTAKEKKKISKVEIWFLRKGFLKY